MLLSLKEVATVVVVGGGGEGRILDPRSFIKELHQPRNFPPPQPPVMFQMINCFWLRLFLSAVFFVVDEMS